LIRDFNQTLVRYDERFKLINTMFIIFGSISVVVILIALAVFGYFFNQLSGLIRVVAHIEEKYESSWDRFEKQLFQDDIINRLKIRLREDFSEISKVADQKAKYKAKSE